MPSQTFKWAVTKIQNFPWGFWWGMKIRIPFQPIRISWNVSQYRFWLPLLLNSSKFRWDYRFGWITLSHTPSDRKQNGKEPPPGPNGQVFTGSNIGTTGQAFKVLWRNFSADFPVAIFFWVQRFSQNFEGPGTWWYGKALCCDVSSREVSALGPPSNFSPSTDFWRAANGSNLELFAWNRSYGQMVSTPQPTPTFKKEDKSIHNFPDSQRPAGSSPQVPESYTSTWRDL